jgi:allantoate deiminase
VTAPGAARALERCDALATLTSMDGGIERVAFSPEHRAANDLVGAWLAEAGLVVRQDAAGNVVGRLEGATPGLPALLLGSHLDTVTDAGRYDGMLGVLLAIEVADRLARRAEPLPFALEVVGFTDEEGTRFGNALLGSRALAGRVDAAWLATTDRGGTAVAAVMRGFGLDPDRIGDAARRPEDLVGYLEAHIEQGPQLLDAGKPLGVVTGIAGARRFALEVVGRAGHAGGTPYPRRRDALVAAAEIVLAVERIAIDTGTIGTVGRIRAFPGGVNVVPGTARLSLDLRAETDEARDDAFARIDAAVREIAERRRVTWSWEELYRADATACDPVLLAAVEAGIRTTGDPSPERLWSRAGHDGMAVADVTGVAMLFLRCGNEGVSHSPDETVTAEDTAAALDAFEAAVLAVAAGRRG